MSPLERIRKPKQEVKISNEYLEQVVNKLLTDLQKGYIVEAYDTQSNEGKEKTWGDESLIQDAKYLYDGYCVVLKGKKYFKVEVTRGHVGYHPDQQYLRVAEYGSQTEMSDWQNATRTIGFLAPDEFFARRCWRYKFADGEGWSQCVLEPESTVDLLRSVLRAKVNKKTTLWSFENDVSNAKKPSYSLQRIVRWPKIETNN